MADLIARLKPTLPNPYLEPGPDERAFAEDLKARGVTVILKKGRLGYSSPVPLPQEVKDRLRHMHGRCPPAPSAGRGGRTPRDGPPTGLASYRTLQAMWL
jgi:hypothetical protein